MRELQGFALNRIVLDLININANENMYNCHLSIITLILGFISYLVAATLLKQGPTSAVVAVFLNMRFRSVVLSFIISLINNIS